MGPRHSGIAGLGGSGAYHFDSQLSFHINELGCVRAVSPLKNLPTFEPSHAICSGDNLPREGQQHIRICKASASTALKLGSLIANGSIAGVAFQSHAGMVSVRYALPTAALLPGFGAWAFGRWDLSSLKYSSFERHPWLHWLVVSSLISSTIWDDPH